MAVDPPAWRDPAPPTRPLRPTLCPHLGQPGFPAAVQHRGSGAQPRVRAARTAQRADRRARRDALWLAVPGGRAARLGGHGPAAPSGPAFVSPILGHHDSLGARCLGGRTGPLAPTSRSPDHRRLPRRSPLHRSVGAPCRGTLAARGTRGEIVAVVPRHPGALRAGRGPLLPPVPCHGAAAARASRRRPRYRYGCVPVARRAREMAPALHRRDPGEVGW